MVRKGDMLSVEDVEEILGIDLIGVVGRDDSVIVAANCGEPVVYNSKSFAGKSFSDIAARICGENIPITKTQSFWGRFGRRLGMTG